MAVVWCKVTQNWLWKLSATVLILHTHKWAIFKSYNVPQSYDYSHSSNTMQANLIGKITKDIYILSAKHICLMDSLNVKCELVFILYLVDDWLDKRFSYQYRKNECLQARSQVWIWGGRVLFQEKMDCWEKVGFFTHILGESGLLCVFFIESELFARPLRGKVILGESRELFPWKIW